MTTGDALGIGHSNCGDSSGCAWNHFVSGWTGNGSDPTLDLINSNSLAGYDATVIEFDIVPTNDTLCFDYVFGSEEYNEYVGSVFNDVFGFFVTGPGYAPNTNIARVPNDTLPVAVNNINCGINGQYYICNDAQSSYAGGCNASVCPNPTNISTSVAYDGFTTPLCAKLIVIPDSTYHIKLAIQDVADGSFDSGIFLSIESLCGGSSLACIADFLPGFGSDPFEVDFINSSIYGSSWSWDFGDGNTSIEKHPQHIYATDGTYNVMLVTCNFSGCDTTYQTVTIGSVGINEVELSDIAVYPNPATNSLQVKSISGANGLVKIFDALGRLMIEQTINQNDLVDVSEWSNGVYTVEFTSDNKVSRTRFYKQ
jgi:PKD repeat protein